MNVLHQIEIFIQDGDSSKSKKIGPLKIDCGKEQDAWQYFEPGQINLKFGLSIQSGHACADIPRDFNLDDVHVKYSKEYVDVAEEIKDKKRCSAHDGGASCVLPI